MNSFGWCLLRFFWLSFLYAVFSGTTMQAKFYQPDFEQNFYNQLNRHNLAVVHFNPFEEDEDEEPELDKMIDALYALSKDSRYKQADMAFIEVNIPNLPELAQDYDVPVVVHEEVDMTEEDQEEDDALLDEEEVKKEELPQYQSTLMLFKDGKPFKDGTVIVKRTGFLTRLQIKDLIERYFGTFIDRVVKETEAQEVEREQTRVTTPPPQQTVVRERVVYPARTRTYYSRRPYYGYYRPYRPYRYWSPGFGIGFGFGFGGRRGFGRRGGFGRRRGFGGRRGGFGGRGRRGGGGRRR